MSSGWIFPLKKQKKETRSFPRVQRHRHSPGLHAASCQTMTSRTHRRESEPGEEKTRPTPREHVSHGTSRKWSSTDIKDEPPPCWKNKAQVQMTCLDFVPQLVFYFSRRPLHPRKICKKYFVFWKPVDEDRPLEFGFPPEKEKILIKFTCKTSTIN